MDKEKTKESARKTKNAMKQALPVLFGVVLLVALLLSLFPKEAYSQAFVDNGIIDSFIGAAFGSIAAGNPLTSYVIGGELVSKGITMVAVIAFIVAWVTVGIFQLPAEIAMLGKRFALARNLVSFLLSIVVAILTVFTLGAIA